MVLTQSPGRPHEGDAIIPIVQMSGRSSPSPKASELGLQTLLTQSSSEVGMGGRGVWKVSPSCTSLLPGLHQPPVEVAAHSAPALAQTWQLLQAEVVEREIS